MLHRHVIALAVLLAATACHGDDAPPSAATTTAPATPTTPTGSSVATAAPRPSASTVGAAPDAAAAATTPFCRAALEDPMIAVIERKCTEVERGTTLARVIRDDVRAVGHWCDRAFAHPERVQIDERVSAACAPKIAEKATALALDKTKSLQAFRKLHELAECRELVVGNQPEGAACGDDVECASGLTCRGLSRERVEGACRKRGQKGDSCDDHYSLDLAPNHDECAPGLACVDDVCTPLRAEGAPCDRWPVCKSGNCLVLAGKDSGTCAPPSANGAKCGDESDCTSRRCAKGKCEDRSKAGATCAQGSDCLGICDDKTHTCVSFCGSG